MADPTNGHSRRGLKVRQRSSPEREGNGYVYQGEMDASIEETIEDASGTDVSQQQQSEVILLMTTRGESQKSEYLETIANAIGLDFNITSVLG